jgi:hypothetical protein
MIKYIIITPHHTLNIIYSLVSSVSFAIDFGATVKQHLVDVLLSVRAEEEQV